MQHFRGSSRRRAVAFESVADAHDWIAVPPATRSALAEMRDRPPPRARGRIEIHETTDGAAVLRRVLAEPIPDETSPDAGEQHREHERLRKARWRARRDLGPNGPPEVKKHNENNSEKSAAGPFGPPPVSGAQAAAIVERRTTDVADPTATGRTEAARAAHVKRQQRYRQRLRERSVAEEDIRRRQAMTALAEGHHNR